MGILDAIVSKKKEGLGVVKARTPLKDLKVRLGDIEKPARLYRRAQKTARR